MRTLTILLCMIVFGANAQNKSSRISTAIDNGIEVNADGTNNFKTPVGLDLLGGNSKGITIYPNATHDCLLISVEGSQKEKRQICMATAGGQLVYETSDRKENTFMLDASGLRKGVYIIEVTSGTRIYKKKWAKR